MGQKKQGGKHKRSGRNSKRPTNARRRERERRRINAQGGPQTRKEYRLVAKKEG